VLHLQSKRGLLRRVLNSGLLLREGYSTPEAGKRLLFNRTFFCNRISLFNRISFCNRISFVFDAEQALPPSLTTLSPRWSGCTAQRRPLPVLYYLLLLRVRPRPFQAVLLFTRKLRFHAPPLSTRDSLSLPPQCVH
jgi:hypothetical protein